MNILDVSYSQKNIDYKAVKESGEVEAVCIRASQGHTISDEMFKIHHDGFKSVGIPIGAYHFFMFDSSPAQQAQFFLEQIAGREGELLPMVDCEGDSLLNDPHSSIGDRMQWLHTFNAYLLDHFPAPCHNLLLYTPLDFWNTKMNGTSAFQGHFLWLAEYNNDSRPELPKGFVDWKLWQHTSKGAVTGIDSPVDLSYFNGFSLEEITRK